MIEDIRKHSKLIIWLFSFVSLAFIAEEGLMYFLRSKERKEIVDGDMFIVDGEVIKYSEFKQRYDERMSYFVNHINMPLKDSFLTRYVRGEIMRDMPADVAYKHLANNLGFRVGKDEIIDLVQGENISDSIKNSFKNKDGVFDKAKLMEFLNNMSVKKKSQDFWCAVEQQIRQDRNKEKVKSLLTKMSAYSLLEAEKDWEYDNTKFDLEYLYVPFTSIEDKDCHVSEQMLKDYLAKNQRDFQGEEAYKLQYFIVDYKIADEDVKNNKNLLEPLKEKFSICPDPVDFAKVKSDKDLKKGVKGEHSVKLVYKDLPKEIKDKNSLKIGDTFVTIAATMKEANKIYRITNVENLNKKPEERSYEASVIYKKPVISKNYKDQTIDNLTSQLRKVSKVEEFAELAKSLSVKLKKKNVKLNEYSIEGVDDTRKLIHSLIKTYKKPGQGKVFIIKPFHNEYGVFCGVVTKYFKKGTKDLEDVQEDVNSKCVKNLKYSKIMEKINSVLQGNEVSFKEIQDKKIDFIKIGTDKDFSCNSSRLKDYGSVGIVFDKIFCLEKNDVVPFFQDNNGVIMIKIIDKKKKPFDLNNPECKKFVDSKQKNLENLDKIHDVFKTRFVFVDNSNSFV